MVPTKSNNSMNNSMKIARRLVAALAPNSTDDLDQLLDQLQHHSHLQLKNIFYSSPLGGPSRILIATFDGPLLDATRFLTTKFDTITAIRMKLAIIRLTSASRAASKTTAPALQTKAPKRPVSFKKRIAKDDVAAHTFSTPTPTPIGAGSFASAVVHEGPRADNEARADDEQAEHERQHLDAAE